MNVEVFLSLLAPYIKQITIFWSDFTSAVRIDIIKYQNTSLPQEPEDLFEERSNIWNMINHERPYNFVEAKLRFDFDAVESIGREIDDLQNELNDAIEDFPKLLPEIRSLLLGEILSK
jgi:hypothetical protein